MDRVADLLVAYLAAQEAGLEPDIEDYAALCNSEEEGQRLRRESLEVAGVEQILSEPARLPSEIGGFAVEREIGRGGMGVVYAARRPGSGEVAVKVLSDSLLTDRSAFVRFRREVETLQTLEHAHVVCVLDDGVDAGRPFLVMPLLSGGSLEERIQRRRRDAQPTGRAEMRVQVSQLCSIVAAVGNAHAAGIVHRDLKPANILFDACGRAVLTDFGLATWSEASSLTRTGKVLGTLPYMAPERLRDDSTASAPPVDVYSLGVILFELLTGVLPFGGGLPEILAAVRHGPPSARTMTGLPFGRPMCAILDRCLAERAEERYASATELAEDLRRWLDGARVRATRGMALRQARRFCRLHVRSVVMLSSMLLLGAGLLSRQLMRAGEERKRVSVSLVKAAPLIERFEARTDQIWKLIDQRERGRNDWSRRAEFVLEASGVNPRDREIESLRSEAFAFYEQALAALPGGSPLSAPLFERLHESMARWHEREGRHIRAEREWNALTEIRASHPFSLPTCSVALWVQPLGTRVETLRYVRTEMHTAVWPLETIRRDVAGAGPLQLEGLAPGSYLLRLQRPDGERVIHLPLLLGRGERFQIHGLVLPEDGEIGVDWAYVPPGRFVAGGDPTTLGSEARALRHQEGFFVKRMEETVGEYLEFLRDLIAQGRSCFYAPDRESIADRPEMLGVPLHTPRLGPYSSPQLGLEEILTGELPMHFLADCAIHQISPQDVRHYVRWKNERAQRMRKPWIYSLPTGDEWEKAARGVDGRRYAWGDEFDWSLTSGGYTQFVGQRERAPFAVGRFAHDVSPFGLLDVVGNVREICLDRYDHDLRGQDGGSAHWLVRGGEESFYDPKEFSLASRRGALTNELNWDFGFRLVRRRREPGR